MPYSCSRGSEWSRITGSYFCLSVVYVSVCWWFLLAR